MSNEHEESSTPQQPTNGHSEGQGRQTYPGPQYESPQYESPHYGAPRYDAPQGAAPQFPVPEFPVQEFPVQEFPVQEFTVQRSGSSQVPAPEFGTQQFEAQPFGTQPLVTQPFVTSGNTSRVDAGQPEGSRQDDTRTPWAAPQPAIQAPTSPAPDLPAPDFQVPLSPQRNAQNPDVQQPYAQQPYAGQPYVGQRYAQHAGGPVPGSANDQWQTTPPSGPRVAPAAAPSSHRSNPLVSTFTQTPVTWSIIAICVLVWIGERASLDFADRIVLSPYFGRIEPWRFVTSAFAHALSPAHIAFNMYALWTLRMLEVYLGRLRFAVVYLLCAIAGGVAFVVLANPLSPSWISGVVGASGAIFGLFGVLLFAYRDLQASTRQLWIVIGINMAISFTIPGIAWQAHVGGLLMGLMAGWLLVRERDNRRNGHADRSWWWLATLFALEVVVLMLKYAMVRHTWIQ